MKILRILSLLTIATFCIVSSVIYQSCQRIRYCQLLQGIEMTPFNSMTTDTLGNMDSVKSSDFMVSLRFSKTQFSCKNASGFSLIQSAMAFKPNVQEVYFDTIKQITITSDQDFNSTHPAGTSLNDLFEIPDSSSGYYRGQYSDLQYGLYKAPDTEIYHRFSINVEIAGSLPYDTILPPIKILY